MNETPLQGLEGLRSLLDLMVKKYEEAEFKLLEKEEELSNALTEMADLKAQNEKRELEIQQILRELETYRNGINETYESYRGIVQDIVRRV